MNKVEISILREAVAAGPVWYFKNSDVCVLVASVSPKFVVFSDGTEMIARAGVAGQFGRLRPLFALLGDAIVPRTYLERFSEALALLCGGQVPPTHLLSGWLDDTDEGLQDWVVTRSALAWSTGIGTIEAAIATADTPEEGIGGGDGPEHQTREGAFPARP